jgi:hypothetical protein
VNSKPHRVSASIAFEMKFASFVLTSALLAFLSDASRGHQSEAPPTGPKIMVVGVYHFVSKANVYSMSVDDPLR